MVKGCCNNNSIEWIVVKLGQLGCKHCNWKCHGCVSDAMQF